MTVPRPNPITRRDLLVLLVVVLVAAFLRLADVDISEYRIDEYDLSKRALDMASGTAIPRLGLAASAGIPGSPLTVYLMAIPYAFSTSPVIATAFIAALNVVGVGLLWLIAFRYISPLVALLAGLAYAVNPWAILFSRKIWPPDYATPFALLAILLGMYGFWEGKRWAQAACLPAFIFAYSMHHEGAIAVFPLLAIIWVGRQNISWRAISWSIVLGMLVLLPLIIGVVQEGVDKSFTLLSDNRLRPVNVTNYPIYAMLQLASGLEVGTYIALYQLQDLDARVPHSTELWLIIVGGATGLGMVVSWLRRYRHMAATLLLWVLMPILLFVPGVLELVIHYYIVVIPALSLLAGIGAEWLVRLIPGKMPIRAVGVAAFCIVLLMQAIWWRGLVNYVTTTHVPSGFSTPIRYFMNVRDELLKYDDVILIGGGVLNKTKNIDLWSNYLYNIACFRETLIPEGGVAVFPKGRFVTLTPPNVPPSLVDNLYTSVNPLTFPLRPGEGEIVVNGFENAPEWPGPEPTQITPQQFDTGVQLKGYHLGDDTLYLWWTLPVTPPQRNYQYFGHFLDQDGNRIGQRDTSFWYLQHWCPGDRIITWIDVNPPEDASTLRVGMYAIENDQFINSNVLDSAGNPVSQWVDIPLTETKSS
jgi:hypothetical protein